MADFQFEVEISAKIQELEKALSQATTATQKAASMMSAAVEQDVDPAFAGLTDTMADLGQVVREEEAKFESLMGILDRVEDELDDVADTASNKVEPGFEKMLKVVGKVSAALFIAEGAFKLGTAAVKGMTGDTEAMVQALNSLPLIGPLVTSFTEFGAALIHVSDEARHSRKMLYRLDEMMRRVNISATELSASLSAQAELYRATGLDEVRMQEMMISGRREELELQHSVRMDQIEMERRAEVEKIQALQLDEEAHYNLVTDLNQLSRDRVAASKDELETRLLILDVNLKNAREEAKSLKAAEEKASLAKQELAEKEAKDKQKAQREAFKQEMVDMALREAAQMSGISKAKEYEKKKQEEIDAKREEQMAKEAAFLQRRQSVEKEIAAARKEAEAAVAGATATFSTAGGSFTTAATAQVSETKLLRSISQQSRDFLQEIVNNTAMMVRGTGGVGFV